MNTVTHKSFFIRSDKKRFHSGMGVLLVFGLLFFSHHPKANPGEKSENKVQKIENNTIKVKTFDLRDVRLLNSPFKQRMEMDEKYMMKLNMDRLLAPFMKSAGLKPKGRQYKGWETSQLSGAFGGQYLSGLSLMYAATGHKEMKNRVDYMVSQLKKCQDKVGTGYIGGIPKGQELWNKVERGIIHTEPFALDSVWSPWYNLHMTFKGLRDAYWYTGNKQAKEMMEKFGDWAVNLSNHLNDQQFKHMLRTEFSGMNEMMADLYSMTGKKKYLDLAKRFNDNRFLDPLAQGVDSLSNQHVNTNIPKVIGAAREYEVDGSRRMANIAKYFFNEVTSKRIYINGEMGDYEYFQKLGTLPQHLNRAAGETGNVYNMLILTRHLMQWDPNVKYVKYYERSLYNVILASQDPSTGMMTYLLSMEPGFFKTFSTPYDSFWCCVGIGVQNHAKYGKVIYMHSKNDLYVNLFIPSVLQWKEKGMTITQHTKFPSSQKSTLDLKMGHSQKLALKIRRPYWAANGFEIKVNGHKIKQTGSPSSYVSIDRTWHNGDKIEISLPMQLHVEHMANDHSKVAVMYGPVLLAGELGGYVPFPYAKNDSQFFDMPAVAVPDLAIANKPVDSWLKPVEGKPLHFKTYGVGQPHDVELAPFYEMTHQHYTVYWNISQDNKSMSSIWNGTGNYHGDHNN
ncbi:MAG TPA: beta-L-arabinofuranosidase domain-containing protein [Balneolales bacterium]|nr:beta-L-arabinofuranosidase domain-containing protein [Balneolales bacterium]